MRRQLIIGSLMLGTLIILGTFHTRASFQYRLQEATYNSGAIRGRVFDAEGKPVSQARVGASRLVSGLLPGALTDDQGNFFIGGLKPGTYMISVAKENNGYPNTISSFHYGSMVLPQITVYAGQVTSGVVIRLGPKAAKLIGRIVDATTNQPIENAQILLSRVDNPKYSYLTGPNQPKVKGRFEILVPAVPFTIKVSAPGYEDWYYGKNDPQERSGAIRIASDATKDLTISLKPKTIK